VGEYAQEVFIFRTPTEIEGPIDTVDIYSPSWLSKQAYYNINHHEIIKLAAATGCGDIYQRDDLLPLPPL